MEPALKQRLIGAVVISALAIVFLPKLIVGHDKDSPAADVSLQLPGAPDRNFETRELPLTTPGSTPPGGVVGMNPNAPPLPSPAPLAGPAPTDANGNPLPANPNAPAIVAPTINTAAGANGAIAAAATLPTTQSALPAMPVASTPVVSTPVVSTPAQPASTTPGTTVPAAQPNIPIPAARAGGNYVVSAGIYSNAANAQSLMNSLKAAQLPAYAETVSVNGKTSTRVRIGPFAQRGDAEAARLHAQQVRTDMTASVTALDAATEAPVAKPVVAPPAAAFNSAVGKPAAIKPVTTTTPSASIPVVPTSVAPATTKAATAAPTPSAAAARGYVVQVSAFRTEEEALALRNRLRAAGFTTFSERVQLESGTLYRVRVGPAADRDAADLLRISLSQKMGLSGMVVAYP